MSVAQLPLIGELTDAVKTLGFGDALDVFEALLDPYGVAVHSTDGADVEKLAPCGTTCSPTSPLPSSAHRPPTTRSASAFSAPTRRAATPQLAITAAKARRSKKDAPTA